MAVRNVSEGVSNWTNKMFFPTKRYSICCIEEEATKSEKGHPMLVRTFEIVAPETIDVGGKPVNLVGTKVTQYRVTKVADGEGGWDMAKSDKAFGSFRDELVNAGYDESEIDDENPPCFFKGKTFDAILYGKKTQAFESPTDAERAEGKRIGAAIKDADGKDVINYQIQIDQILGLSEKQIGVAY